MSQKSTSILILAAGQSKRMGQPKQLLPHPSGLSMIAHAIVQAAQSKAADVTLVLGAHCEEIRQHLTSSAEVVVREISILENPDWESGMGSSIACGTRKILSQPALPTHLLIMLADQPLMDDYYLNILIKWAQVHPSRPIATGYKGKPGVPAIFPDNCFEALSVLEGDKGAKTILRSQDAMLVDAGERTIDLDTPQAYSQFKQRFS